MHANVVDLTRIFKTSLYGLAMFAGLILGAAEGAWLPYGTLLLAVVGYWATEAPGHFALGSFLSNVFGLIAVGLSGIEFFGDNPEGRLLAGTHLVVYATWIVFLQQSSLRKYWSICALSVLQVSVAAVLTKQSWYGAALIAFAVYSMWTLAVFSLYHIVAHFQTLSLQPAAAPSAARRFTGAVSEAGHEIQLDAHGRWITARFVTGVALLSVMALMMSAAFYVLTPRVWIGKRFSVGEADDDVEMGRRNLTGFTPQVKLGDLGQILESLEVVMTINAYDMRYGEHRLSAPELAELMGYDEPLFRGGVMIHYNDGAWQSETFNESPDPLPRTPPRFDVLQEITLEPVAGEILFCFGTPTGCEILPNRNRASFNGLTGVLRQGRRFHESRGAVSYLLYTNLPQRSPDGIPRVELRSSEALSGTRRNPAIRRYLDRCLLLPDNALPRLVELSRSIADDEERKLGRKPSNIELARRLESYLRDSGEFSYSMNLTIQDTSIDPVEDFLINRKTGHCEYFATALALMLRAVNVPSRLMNGFKGGETNYRGQIEVQQRHAHTWVEAWDGEGKWLVLDPTPAARAESVKEVADISVWKWIHDFFSGFWSDWVMNFTPERQRDDLYLPLKDFAQKFLEQAEDAASNGPAIFAWLWKFLSNPREWFSVTGLILGASLTAGTYAALRAFQWLRQWWLWTRSRVSKLAARRTIVPFYERFVQLMTARGLVRPADHTPAEFARDVAARLNGTLATAELGQAPGLITDCYYRVRFGDVELSPAEVSSVNAALERLEHAEK